jgi:CheY-like chemotaxis protein
VELAEKEFESGETDVRSLPSGRYAELTVSDTGHGIEPSVVNKIFEPYFTTKEQGKGTGLGLSVVYGIVKDHGGDIVVRSRPEKGTTFYVYLPLLAEDAENAQSQPSEFENSGTERILLVDDDESILRLEKQVLERLGYKPTAHASSLDALETFMSDPDAFDIVVTDMTMPKMTGDRLARKVKEIRPAIPVVICTGFSERIDEEKSKSLGIEGFLKKPVYNSDLASMVRKVLDEANGSPRR